MGQQQTAHFYIRLALAGLALCCALPFAYSSAEAAVERPADIPQDVWEKMTNLEEVMQLRQFYRIEDERQLVALIEKGFDIHERDEEGRGYLHYCAMEAGPWHSSFVQIAKVLLDEGVEVGVRDAEGFTSLHWAANASYVPMIGLLLEHGADPNALTITDESPLDWVGSSEACSFLLAYGAELRNSRQAVLVDDSAALNDFLSGQRLSTEAHSAQSLLDVAVEANAKDCLPILIDNIGDHGELKNLLGETLQVAARSGNTAMLALLVRHGADVNYLSSGKMSALHYAAQNNQSDSLNLLAVLGAEIDTKNDGGLTPLHFASFNLQTDAVRLLLLLGADPDAAENRGMTALHQLGGIYGQITISAAGPSKLLGMDYFEAMADQCSIARMLSIAGADMNRLDHFALTALDYLSPLSSEDNQLNKLLLELGAEHSLTWLNKQGSN